MSGAIISAVAAIVVAALAGVLSAGSRDDRMRRKIREDKELSRSFSPGTRERELLEEVIEHRVLEYHFARMHAVSKWRARIELGVSAAALLFFGEALIAFSDDKAIEVVPIVLTSLGTALSFALLVLTTRVLVDEQTRRLMSEEDERRKE